ncbi:hypothetical protein [Aliiruegeria lutimaris]|uniref:Uncharacterized protein n=1 Tax=Aliiruegeria lutimaris TaxID=571298 RepID=A0A1G9MDH8_9RHOB|nr:hypothetical protein [Aliiruegeria lutimaris]SDL72316.1 hypothetical protein SAMN04488026_11093 [Aliiruegeria lutimaris]
MTHAHLYPTPSELERLIWHMPKCAEGADNDWSKNFAMSIVRQSFRKNWKPSPKQVNIMRRMVSDLFVNAGQEEFSVIE